MSAELPRELTTERLLLRQWREADVDALFEIYQDREVEAMLVPMSREATERQVALFSARWAERGLSLWAAEELDTGRLVGRVGLHHADEWPLDPGAVEVGWTFARDVWGRGYATEGGQVALEHAFATLDLDRVISFTRINNLASRRVMEKLGLTRRGESDYKGIPHVWYAIDRPIVA